MYIYILSNGVFQNVNTPGELHNHSCNNCACEAPIHAWGDLGHFIFYSIWHCIYAWIVHEMWPIKFYVVISAVIEQFVYAVALYCQLRYLILIDNGNLHTTVFVQLYASYTGIYVHTAVLIDPVNTERHDTHWEHTHCKHTHCKHTHTHIHTHTNTHTHTHTHTHT